MQFMTDIPLFAGIKTEQLDALLSCLAARQRTYPKDAFIFRADERAVYVGIVLSGGAHIIQEDFWGNRSIVTHVAPGELFGEAFSCAETERLPVSVIAAEPSEVLLIDYKKIIGICPATCVFHSRLISNMLHLIAKKNITLTRKMSYMSKRTTRDKLLAFLSDQTLHAQTNEITIPFNRQELADYLCVDRSALSRVLMEMKKEGVLDYDRNRFALL